MKKLIILAAITLMSAFTFADEIKLSESSQASALGQIADKNLAGTEATAMIKNILSGQSYDVRVSIMSTSCDKSAKSSLTLCTVAIGQDDMNDDDRGWGSVYNLNYSIDKKGTVVKATFELVAG